MTDPLRDPFDERPDREPVRIHRVAGAFVAFSSSDAALFALVDEAFGRILPTASRFARPRFHVRLVPTEDAGALPGDAPPVPRVSSCEGVITATVDAANYVIVNPDRRSARVAISPAMLRFRYHARYELLEFAVFELLARSRGMLSLHAACVGNGRSCVMLLGDSGAGKSTACAAALVAGLQFVAEDSVMIDPRAMTAVGVPSFLHVNDATSRLLRETSIGTPIAGAPRIRRRSGAEKIEFDVRGRGLELSTAPTKIVAWVVLSAKGGPKPEMRTVAPAVLRRLLADTQPYASGRPAWRQFLARAARVPAFELSRGDVPAEMIELLRTSLIDRRRGDTPRGSSRSPRTRSAAAAPPVRSAATPSRKQTSAGKKAASRAVRAGI